MSGAVPEARESLWRLIFGPLVWAAHFLLSYVTGAIGCAKLADTQDEIGLLRLLVALYTAMAMALIAGAADHQWRRQRHASAQPAQDAGGREHRQRFLGLAGLLLCGLSAVAVIYTAAVVVAIRGCA